MRPARIAILLLAVVAAACAQATKAPSGPAAAPDFQVRTFEGETFRLDEHRGSPVVLNFWESW